MATGTQEDQRSVTHSTFIIERQYPVSPDRVFGAFSDPDKKRRWFLEGEGMTPEHFESDFRVGGVERSRFRSNEDTPVKGMTLENYTSYHDIDPNRRIVLAYTMTVGERRISTSLATFEFIPSGTWTKLIFTEQAAFFPGSDGPKIREEGWRLLLGKLEEVVTS